MIKVFETNLITLVLALLALCLDLDNQTQQLVILQVGKNLNIPRINTTFMSNFSSDRVIVDVTGDILVNPYSLDLDWSLTTR